METRLLVLSQALKKWLLENGTKISLGDRNELLDNPSSFDQGSIYLLLEMN